MAPEIPLPPSQELMPQIVEAAEPPLPEPVERIRSEISSFSQPVVLKFSGETRSIYTKERKLTPQTVLLFPFSPEGPRYSLHKKTSKSGEGFHASPLQRTVGVLTDEEAVLKQGEGVLMPLSHGEEALVLSIGVSSGRRGSASEAASVQIKQIETKSGTKYIMQGLEGKILGEIGENPCVIASQEFVKTATIKETSYPDGREPTVNETIAEKTDSHMPRPFCTISLVTSADGKKYLFAEGDVPEGVRVWVSPKLAEETRRAVLSPREIVLGDRKTGIAMQASERHPGRNEDFATVYNGTYMLLDGMGGEGEEKDGYRASRIAAAVIQSVLDTLSKNASAQAVGEKFEEAIKLANTALAENLPSGGGTTVVLARQVGNALVYRKVGDSRLAIFDGERIVFETPDQNIINLWEQSARENEGWVSLGLRIDEFLERKYKRGNRRDNVDSFVRECQVHGYQVKSSKGDLFVSLEQIQLDTCRDTLDRVADASVLDPIESYAFFLRNFISTSVGGPKNHTLSIESGTVAIKSGQRIILYSDGVGDVPTKYQRAKTLRIVADRSPKEQAYALVSAAEGITTGTIKNPSHPYHAVSLDGQESRAKKDDRSAIVGVV